MGIIADKMAQDERDGAVHHFPEGDGAPPETPPAHAKLSPSGADRWLTCTSSVEFTAKYPEQKTSSFAQEGTDAHDLLERAVKAKTRPSELEPEHPACMDVDQCYDLVAKYLDDPNYVVLSEVKVVLSEDCWGTADLIVMGNGVLGIIDYKHGKGVVVEVPSIQLNIYAIAALKSLGWMAPEPITTVVTTICQPRAQHPNGPVRTKGYSLQDMLDYEAIYTELIDCIKSGETEFRPSEKACRWCAGKGDCEAQAEMALEIAKSHFTPLGDVVTPAVQDVGTLSVDQKAEILTATSFIKAFLDAVASNIKTALMAGESVPGLKVVAGRSNRAWGTTDDEGKITKLDADAVMAKLADECKLKKSQVTTAKLLGIPAIEKLIDPKKRGGKKKLEALKAIIVKPEGKPTVVSEEDARPSVAPHFKPVETGKNPLD